MPARRAVLDHLAARLLALPVHPIPRVAVDGVDGAGKTTFADDLAAVLRAQGREVVRVGLDGFHHPRAVRYQRGRTSPEGFYRDSYDLDAFRRAVLDPLEPGGPGIILPAVFDVAADQPVPPAPMRVPPGALLLVDGLFLHRPELRRAWHESVFLRVPFEVSIPRGASRGPGFGSPDPHAESNRRYVEGQRLYFADAEPERWAGVVLDHTNLARPALVEPQAS